MGELLPERPTQFLDTLGWPFITPQGTIVQTGDFKFDLTPVGNLPGPNLQQMAKLGDDGVLLLTSDSTNAERPEFTKSERWVDIHIRRIFERIKGTHYLCFICI